MNCRTCHRPMEEVLRGHKSGGRIYLCRTCETTAAVTAEEAALAFPDEALTVRGDSAAG